MKTEKILEINQQDALEIIETNAIETLYTYGDWSECVEIADIYRNGITAVGFAYRVPDADIQERCRRIFDETDTNVAPPVVMENEKIETLLHFLKQTKQVLNSNLYGEAARKVDDLIEFLEDCY